MSGHGEIEAAIHRRLTLQPMRGDRLCAALGVAEAEFRAAATRLWADFQLQGLVQEGCCRAPCGPDCVAANRMSRTWALVSAAD